MRRRVDCEHRFVDPKTGRTMLPFVNVLAEAGKSTAMTLGRRYVCSTCRRIIDLRVRARLPLPEAPIDTRTMDIPFIDWTELEEQPQEVAWSVRQPAVASRVRHASAL